MAGDSTITDTAARLWARGVIGIAMLTLALLSCYGLLALTLLLPLAGIRFALDEGAWTGTIVALVVLTVGAVLPGFRRHGSHGPAVGAVAGGGLILHALLFEYDVLVEFAGFVLLGGAVGADALLRRRTSRPMAGAPPAG